MLIKEENPCWSGYTCFYEAVRNRKFTKDRIARAFNRLVPKDDYFDSKTTIIRHLSNASMEEGTPYETGRVDRLRVAKIKSSDYAVWRKAVFKRDNNTCVICGTKFPLVAHHIVEFVKSPELRMAVNNGVTLCVRCHRDVHKKILSVPKLM